MCVKFYTGNTVFIIQDIHTFNFDIPTTNDTTNGKIRENIDFLAVNTPPANTISYYSGCDDLARNMAAVGACGLRLLVAASKRSKE